MSDSIKIQAYIKKLSRLLKMERKAHLAAFNQMISNTSLHRRQRLGVSWYPLRIIKQGRGLGDRPYIEVERTQGRGQKHEFKAGKMVNLFGNQPANGRKGSKATIHYVNGDRMRLDLHSQEVPNWIKRQPFGVDVFFDERTFEVLDKSLRKMAATEEGRLFDLMRICLGLQKPHFEDNQERPFFSSALNASQSAAVNRILNMRDLAVIHGPPGTGKTTTLIAAIEQLSHYEKNLLVCAPSNAATDLLTERLAEKGLKVVRVGNLSRINESLLGLSLEGQLSQQPEYMSMLRMKEKATHLRKMISKRPKQDSYELRALRRKHRLEAISLMDQAKMLEQFVIDRILRDADVICTTLVGAASPYLEQRRFETVFIDEAAQALEPATWIPLLRADKMVLAGDPYQLPPTVVSYAAQKKGLQKTLLERCIDELSKVSLLRIQYRMNPIIMGFSSEQFYNGELEADESAQSHFLTIDNDVPIEFIDTKDQEFHEQFNPRSQSYFNPEEFYILGQHLDILLAQLPKNPPPSVGIIAPYKEQTDHIREALEEHIALWGATDIAVNTVDAFQGQERDIIYLSLVRSNKKGKIGFLRDIRRMNVAITRAKMKLVVIGDSSTVGKHAFYRDFIQYVKDWGAYQKL